ncbi:MAG: hypothetical protein KatS3mg024_2668 [Armatimonadota bacterium]|nr:MAG: hypothetical protein KatS3mg024_2668 [Armatimonadota bacterium]
MAMTFRERTIRIFRHEPVDNIVYQPRIEHWYNYNKRHGTLPPPYDRMELLEVYDHLGCSIRPYHYFNDCLKIEEHPDVRTEVRPTHDGHIVFTITPVGALVRRVEVSELARHTVEYPVKSAEDVDTLEWLLRNRTAWFDMDLFRQLNEMVGERTAPMMYLPRVNMQRILIELVGWENALFMLADDRPLLERLVRIINETDETWLQVVLDCPIEIFNFGDNIDEYLLSPPLFEEFVLPVYQDRARRFRERGKFTHSHFDGNVKHLLKYLQVSGLDGFEALTPQPQGDLTIQEMKEALGDNLILLDGIPMTAFLPSTPYEEFERQTREIIETFSPNLILGISDEPSPVCDIERVRRAGEIMEEYAR